MQRVLSFEQTPVLAVPLRFFLTAPAFAILAGLLLAWTGPGMLVSRWTPDALALTHLLTLGFLGMCMLGALLQILPVVSGIEIPYAKRTATIVHVLLALGTLALASGFFFAAPMLLRFALLMLGGGFGWLLLILLKRVWTAPHASPMLVAIRLALSALTAAVVSGATAAAGFAWPISLPLLQITDLHVSWGLLGWLGLLVAGVAYQVVPMFQVTPTYPEWMTRGLAWTVFTLLILRSVVLPYDSQWESWLTALLILAWVTFAAITLNLLRQRKRPKPDATTYFWRTALASIVAAAALWLVGVAIPDLASHPAFPFTLGALVVAGFGYTVVNGMLYKIVPFLVWYHLQNHLDGRAKAPNVRQILPDRDAERQYWLHLLALALLVAAPVFPAWLSRPAGVVLAISSAWLWFNLFKAVKMYRTTASTVTTAPA